MPMATAVQLPPINKNEDGISEDISDGGSAWDSDEDSDENSKSNEGQKKTLWSWFQMDSKFKNECFVQDTVHILTKISTRLLKPSIVLPLG